MTEEELEQRITALIDYKEFEDERAAACEQVRNAILRLEAERLNEIFYKAVKPE